MNTPFKPPGRSSLGNSWQWKNSARHPRSEIMAEDERTGRPRAILPGRAERTAGQRVDGWIGRQPNNDHRRLLRVDSARDAPATAGSVPDARAGKRHFAAMQSDTILDNEQLPARTMVQSRSLVNRRAGTAPPRRGVYGQGQRAVVDSTYESDNGDDDDDDADDAATDTDGVDIDSLAERSGASEEYQLHSDDDVECENPCDATAQWQCTACNNLIEQCRGLFEPEWPIRVHIGLDGTPHFDGPFRTVPDHYHNPDGRYFMVGPDESFGAGSLLQPAKSGSPSTPPNTTTGSSDAPKLEQAKTEPSSAV